MKDQINTIRSFIRRCADGDTLPSFAATEALTALAQIEAAVGEEVETDCPNCGHTFYVRAPVAQQYEAGDMASAAAQGFRDGVASVTQQEPVHWRAVLDPAQSPQQLKTAMHVVGFREKKAAEGFVAEQIDFYGWRYTIEPLYAVPVAQHATFDAQRALEAIEALLSNIRRDAPSLSGKAMGFAEEVAAALRDKVAQQPQAKPHKPLFADLIAQHPGLREELKAMDKQPQAKPFGFVSQHTNGTWEFSPTPDGVYPDTAKSITAVYTKQPQAEAVQYTRADLDRAYSAGLVEGERLAIQQAEAVPKKDLMFSTVAMQTRHDKRIERIVNTLEQVKQEQAERYQTVREAFWWRVRIGTGTQTIGRCYTETEAQRLAAELQRAFNDGAFCVEKVVCNGDLIGAAAPQQAEAVPPDVEAVRKALDRAFTMGQSYWADADSESIRANKRSDVTRAKFLEMREEVCAVIAAQGEKP